MRVFGSERIKTMMGRFGIPEDQPIENRFINRTLESAQEKIEGFHFDARKHTLEYDDVMNHQRKIVYERRQKMLRADKTEIEAILQDIVAGREGGEEMTKIAPYVITISRQLGSGGAYLGQRLALRLNALYLDHEIVRQAAQELRISEEYLKARDEKVTSNCLVFRVSVFASRAN